MSRATPSDGGGLVLRAARSPPPRAEALEPPLKYCPTMVRDVRAARDAPSFVSSAASTAAARQVWK